MKEKGFKQGVIVLVSMYLIIKVLWFLGIIDNFGLKNIFATGLTVLGLAVVTVMFRNKKFQSWFALAVHQALALLVVLFAVWLVIGATLLLPQGSVSRALRVHVGTIDDYLSIARTVDVQAMKGNYDKADEAIESGLRNRMVDDIEAADIGGTLVHYEVMNLARGWNKIAVVPRFHDNWDSSKFDQARALAEQRHQEGKISNHDMRVLLHLVRTEEVEWAFAYGPDIADRVLAEGMNDGSILNEHVAFYRNVASAMRQGYGPARQALDEYLFFVPKTGYDLQNFGLAQRISPRVEMYFGKCTGNCVLGPKG